jgi:hypothetical protein
MSQLVLPFLAGPPGAEASESKPAVPKRKRPSRALAQRQQESALVSSTQIHPRAEPAKPPAARTQALLGPRIDLFLSSAQLLAQKLEDLLSEPATVELTDNAWTMVSYKRIAGQLRFRLHHMFCGASEEVVRAIAGFTGRARRAHGRTIDAFIRKNRQLIRTAPAADARALQTAGEVHDLAEIYARLNTQFFGGRIEARIGWGRRAPDRRRRSIKMGVYLHDQRLIRIHPALDDQRVPRLFVELVVFHEMLHQAIPPQGGDDGRRCVHGPEFRAAERRFPGFEQARVWEKAHLPLLLRKVP